MTEPSAAPLGTLAACPHVNLIEHDAHRGRLELSDGEDGYFELGELGLCLGVVLPIDEPPFWWLQQTALWLASSVEAADDALGKLDGHWVLWRRHDRTISASALGESLESLRTIARYLGEILSVDI